METVYSWIQGYTVQMGWDATLPTHPLSPLHFLHLTALIERGHKQEYQRSLNNYNLFH